MTSIRTIEEFLHWDEDEDQHVAGFVKSDGRVSIVWSGPSIKHEDKLIEKVIKVFPIHLSDKAEDDLDEK